MAIIKTDMLIKVDVGANNNKYYKMMLHDNGEVRVEYGRVGANPQKRTYTGGLHEYEKIYREKMGKKYNPAQIHEAESDGSSVKMKINILDIAMSQIKTGDSVSKDILKTLVDKNIHNITSNTQIKFDVDSGLFKTPLGVVTKSAVLQAVEMLDKIEALVSSSGYNDNDLLSYNETFFKLIPTSGIWFPTRKGMIQTKEDVENKRSITDALIDTLNIIETTKNTQKASDDTSEKIDPIFGVELNHVTDKAILKEIGDYFEKSKNRYHGGRSLNSKVNRVFSVKLDSEQDRFEKKSNKIGNVQKLWHGTRVGNILSIFKSGLLMPKDTPGKKAGAMFGHGLYFANQSTKSMGYCDGMYWSGGQSENYIYLFLCSVAVGNYHVPSGSTQKNPPKGCDSYWAKSGVSGVVNDEIIVFNLDQIRIDYLIEIKI